MFLDFNTLRTFFIFHILAIKYIKVNKNILKIFEKYVQFFWILSMILNNKKSIKVLILLQFVKHYIFLEYWNLSKKQEIKYDNISTKFNEMDTIKISENYLKLVEALKNKNQYSNKRWRNVNTIYNIEIHRLEMKIYI